MNNPDRPTVAELAPLIRDIYLSDGGSSGCCLHVVTDDGNYKKSSIAYVLETAYNRDHPTCIKAAEMMMQMTETQISKAVAKAHI